MLVLEDCSSSATSIISSTSPLPPGPWGGEVESCLEQHASALLELAEQVHLELRFRASAVGGFRRLCAWFLVYSCASTIRL